MTAPDHTTKPLENILRERGHPYMSQSPTMTPDAPPRRFAPRVLFSPSAISTSPRSMMKTRARRYVSSLATNLASWTISWHLTRAAAWADGSAAQFYSASRCAFFLEWNLPRCASSRILGNGYAASGAASSSWIGAERAGGSPATCSPSTIRLSGAMFATRFACRSRGFLSPRKQRGARHER